MMVELLDNPKLQEEKTLEKKNDNITDIKSNNINDISNKIRKNNSPKLTNTPLISKTSSSTIYKLLHNKNSSKDNINLHFQNKNFKNIQINKSNNMNSNSNINSNSNDKNMNMNMNNMGSNNNAISNLSNLGNYSTEATPIPPPINISAAYNNNTNFSKTTTATTTTTTTINNNSSINSINPNNNTNNSHFTYNMNHMNHSSNINNTIQFAHLHNITNNSIQQQQHNNNTIQQQQQNISQQLNLQQQQQINTNANNNDIFRKFNNSSPILNLLNDTNTDADINNGSTSTIIDNHNMTASRNNSLSFSNNTASNSNLNNDNKFKHRLPLLNRSKSALPSINNNNNSNIVISNKSENNNNNNNHLSSINMNMTNSINSMASITSNTPSPSPSFNNDLTILNTSNDNSGLNNVNTHITGNKATILAKRSYSQLENTKKDINLKKSILSRRNTQEMIAKTIANKHINEPIDYYAKIVKDSELKLMSMDNKMFSKSAIQSAEQKKEHERQIFALIWLMQNCESKHDSYVPRGRIFAQYASLCAHFKLKPLSQASLGKLIRTVFPDLTTRRLGMRGQSKYHYCGLKLINDTDTNENEINIDLNNKPITITTINSKNDLDNYDNSINSNVDETNNQNDSDNQSKTIQSDNNIKFESENKIGTIDINNLSGGKIAKSGKLNKTLKKIKMKREDTLIDEINDGTNKTENGKSSSDQNVATNSLDYSSDDNNNNITGEKTDVKDINNKSFNDYELYFLDNILDKVFDNNEINLTTFKLNLPKIPIDNILTKDSSNFDKDIILSLESIYMIYCNTIFENVKYFKFDELPKNLPLFATNSISPQMYNLFTSEELYPWIKECDTITHIAIIKYLSHLVINHNSVTDSIFFKLENFINNYSDQISMATKGLPTELVKNKLELSKSFTTVLKKLLILLKFIMSFLKSAETFKDGMNKDWKTIVNLDDIFDLVTTNSAYLEIMKCLKAHILNQTTTFLNDEGPNSLNNVIISLLQFVSSVNEPANTIMDCYVRFTNALIGDISLKSSENLLPWLFFNNITVQLLNYSLEVTKFIS